MISEKRSSMLHGVLLITLFSCAAFYIGEMNFVKELSFSPMIVGIILGMLYANSLRNNLPDPNVVKQLRHGSPVSSFVLNESCVSESFFTVSD